MTATSDELFELPTGSRSGWELNKKGEQLQNVFDRLVILRNFDSAQLIMD